MDDENKFFKLNHRGLCTQVPDYGPVYSVEPIVIVGICWDLETHGTCHFSPRLERAKLKPLDRACCVYGVIVAIVYRYDQAETWGAHKYLPMRQALTCSLCWPVQ